MSSGERGEYVPRTHARDLGPVTADETDDPVDYGDENITLDAHEDRVGWRRRLRENPRTRRPYRVCVFVLGVLVCLLAIALGPLPGPGGIPLFLVGLAVLASEFEWAQRLMHPVQVRLRRFIRWAERKPAWLRVSGSVGLVVTVLCVAWAGLAFSGLPTWGPDPVLGLLDRLPGVDPAP